MKSLINTEILPFKSTASHQGKFVPVPDADRAPGVGAVRGAHY